MIFSGGAATLLMTAMLLTSFPVIRRKWFNVFYFTHIIGLAAIIVVCLHASTMFYCIAPGLSMWLLDWGLRSYELRRRLDGQLVLLGRGWYRYGLDILAFEELLTVIVSLCNSPLVDSWAIARSNLHSHISISITLPRLGSNFTPLLQRHIWPRRRLYCARPGKRLSWLSSCSARWRAKAPSVRCILLGKSESSGPPN